MAKRTKKKTAKKETNSKNCKASGNTNRYRAMAVFNSAGTKYVRL